MREFVTISEDERVRRLEPPRDKVDMVLDTDTYNEVDDQFALAYALLAPQAMSVEAVYAAPFLNSRSTSAGDGMRRSYDEILRVMESMGVESEGLVFKGSDKFLSEARDPVVSAAAEDLVQRAMARDSDDPLYVVAIGAPTNVSSAILLEPKIAEHIIVVWLGGQPHEWHTLGEFNMQQDLHASRVLFDSGVPFVQVPCTNVAEHLRISMPELNQFVRGKSALGDYLCDIVTSYHEDHFCWSKVIWDISTVAYLVNPDWVTTCLVHSPILTDQYTYSHDRSRPLMRVATKLNRDAIFRDLFTRMAQQA